MHSFHLDRDWYFQMQKLNCEEYVIPFIEKIRPVEATFRVLEIGCGEAGVISKFLEIGCSCVGIELDINKYKEAQKRLSRFLASGPLILLPKDIYLVDPETEMKGKFDLIILKDVIEHIHDQERLMNRMKSYLSPGGLIFFGFPPWQMPFGGHQQICNSPFLSRLPYFHLLPMALYKGVLNAFKENVGTFVEFKETGISIERFEKIVKNTAYTIVNKQHYLINPIYKYKFKMKVRKQSSLIQSIPYIRNFFTTTVFYLIQIH
jgi:SAM-dependent methyltransferase